MEQITEDEVEKAVFAVNPYKAPRKVRLPVVVWQELWPDLRPHIVHLFQKLVDTTTLPKEWKIAK